MSTMTPAGPYFLTDPRIIGTDRVIRVLTDFGDLVAEASAHWITGHCWTVRVLRPMRAEELREVADHIAQIPTRAEPEEPR